MGRIRILPPEVARQIAAGEVIERPASVVKELCENALDAGARRVTVELRAGGAAEIEVSDDGSGLDAEDAPLAFERHATSKLERFEDLAALRTLGFRGEALPSIAAVARVEMVTRPGQAPGATVVRIDGGGAAAITATGAAPGTRVAVRDLFYNVPARRSALRAAGQELAAASDAVAGAALARPDVAFRLRHEGRELLATPGDGDLLSAIIAIWGPETGAAMLPVAGRADGWEVQGYCSTPTRTRGNRGIQYLAVDGRPVDAEALRAAVEAAYYGRMMVRRYPLFVLRLLAGPGLYDANVHPSKRQVRIYHAEQVRELCRRSVAAALARSAPVPELAAPPGRGAAAGSPGPRGTAAAPAPAARPVWAGGEAAEPAGPYPAPAARLPALRSLGQLANAYLLAEAPDGLYLVDQHAAHERIFFEELAARGAGPGQRLLEPAAVRLSAAQWERWESSAAALREIGLAAEEFGDGTLLVRALPAGLGADAQRTLPGLLDRLEDGPSSGLATVRLATAACRAALKAGQRLGAEDAAALLAELGGCADPFHCPHGRPTLLRLGFGELERHFGRR